MSHKKEDNKVDETQVLQAEAIEAINKTEDFIHKNRNILLICLISIIVIIAGILAYKNLYVAPRAEKAESAMHKAQMYFERDSFQIALEGNGADIMGFTDIIEQYGNTKSGNLAHYYAGVSYYHLEQPEKAMEHLKKYKGNDIMVAPVAHGLIGDCLVQLGRTQESVKYFEDAAKMADNNALSPIYLIKAGIACEALGDSDRALKMYSTVKEKYYNSPSMLDAEKHIQAINLKK